MDYIELAETALRPNPLGYFMGAAFLLAGIFFAVSVFSKDSNVSLMETSFMVAFIAGAVVCFILPTAIAPKPDLDAAAQHRIERTERIQNEIVNYYGLELTDKEVGDLRYPEDRPTGGLKTFGNIAVAGLTEDGDILRREITLVWKDGKMILAQSEDGENFLPLETQN